MKIWIDRDKCTTTLSACLSCFGQLIRTGVPDRGCIMDYEDDGSEDVTVYMTTGDHEEEIFIPEEMQEMVAYEGWDKFVSFKPGFLSGRGARPPTE